MSGGWSRLTRNAGDGCWDSFLFALGTMLVLITLGILGLWWTGRIS